MQSLCSSSAGEGGGCRGVLNIVHGTRDVVNGILDHPDIKAVSFVGSNAAGRYISERASANGKRVQVGACMPVKFLLALHADVVQVGAACLCSAA